MKEQAKLIRLVDAISEIEALTGERPHTATISRWAQRGLSGVRLKTVYALGCRRTTVEWLTAFFEEVQQARSSEKPTESTSAQTRVEEAKRRLAREGM